jgi:hypothetical protein
MVVFLLKHNPELDRGPTGSRAMADDISYKQLELQVLGNACLDWFFWNASTKSADPKLEALNKPAMAAIVKQVLMHAEPLQV